MKSLPRIFIGAGALIHRRGRLLLVKRDEPPDRGKWSFPGGAVEFGETTEQAAIREVKEETGLDIKVEVLFDVVTYLPSDRGPKARNQVIVIDYLALAKASGRVRLNHESSGYGWFTPAQVQRLNTTQGVKRCAAKFAEMRTH